MKIKKLLCDWLSLERLPQFYNPASNIVQLKTVALSLTFCAITAHAQDFPLRPIRIVTVETGSGQDITARLIVRGLSERLGQPVIVDNRGTIAINIVAKAPRDGHTVLFYGPTLWLGPFLRTNSDYDPVRDFAPVTLAVISSNILAVYPALPVKSVKELIALGKERPGELNYGSGSSGSNSHLAAELLKSMAGINIVRIPYKGAGLALNDVVAGHVQMIISTAGSVEPHMKSGRVRALAVTSAQPSRVFPGLPTIASTVPGYESSAMTGMFVPAGTPASVIRKLNQETVRSLGDAEVKERLLGLAIETVASSPSELATSIQNEMSRMGKLIKDAGIKE